jgi:hypothetical protein
MADERKRLGISSHPKRAAIHRIKARVPTQAGHRAFGVRIITAVTRLGLGEPRRQSKAPNRTSLGSVEN